MAQSIVTSLAKFLQQQGYSTKMWENGCTPEAANAVCHQLTEWMKRDFGVEGEFLLLWSRREDANFCGDNELCFLMEATRHDTAGGDTDHTATEGMAAEPTATEGVATEPVAYLVPNPFLEGDAEGFIVACQALVSGRTGELYTVQVRERILYNAV